MKKLLKGELRFVPRKVDKKWRVYDKARGSFPYTGPEYGGAVAQDTTEEMSVEESQRLNQLLGIGPKTVELEPAAEVQEDQAEVQESSEPVQEVEAYEELTDDQKKAYEDGLMENVTY